VSWKNKIDRYKSKNVVYSYYQDNSFDSRDRERLKPMTRLRDSEEEIELEKQCDVKLRVKDWYKDIDTGFSKL
jgi:hypothetical protein